MGVLAQRLKNDDDEAKEAVDKFAAVFKSEKLIRQYWA